MACCGRLSEAGDIGVVRLIVPLDQHHIVAGFESPHRRLDVANAGYAFPEQNLVEQFAEAVRAKIRLVAISPLVPQIKTRER